VPYVTAQLHARGDTPVIASTDYMKLFSDQIRKFVPGTYRVLGTDGFGRSDYRRKLRAHFEVDRHFVAVAAIKALADENKVPSTKVADAIKKYDINPDKPNPATA
jgi:pyruvate dehydrogenase E1 component